MGNECHSNLKQRRVKRILARAEKKYAKPNNVTTTCARVVAIAAPVSSHCSQAINR
ncbi:Uncharacterised protein [Vibrio cholerae]|nr:Uncharacterised protein [Vibrio cholerae]CSI77523.1 Uncharacterised protein [Vibrio cholerae]